MNDNELQHFGVLGMKWGRRKTIKEMSPKKIGQKQKQLSQQRKQLNKVNSDISDIVNSPFYSPNDRGAELALSALVNKRDSISKKIANNVLTKIGNDKI